jgi:hypothetical protein
VTQPNEYLPLWRQPESKNKQQTRIALLSLLINAYNGMKVGDITQQLVRRGHLPEDVRSALLVGSQNGDILIDAEAIVTLAPQQEKPDYFSFQDQPSEPVTRLAHPLR